MNNVVNRSSPELESQAAASRARLSGTLDELASNLTPGRMLDEVMSYSRHGGADFLRGLRNAAAANPIPAVLIGAGCAMFLSGKGRFSENMGSFAPKQRSTSSSDGASRASPSQTGKGVVAGLKESAASMASSVSGAVSDSAAGIGAAASDAASQVRNSVADTASQMRDSVTDTASRLGESGKSAQAAIGAYAAETQERLSEQTGRIRDQTLAKSRELGERAASFVEEQPLIVAAGGFLLGAAIAALLPRTQMEDSYLGEASDAVKETVGNVAAQQYEQAKAAAGEVVEKVKDAAEQEGLSTESVREVGDKLQRIVESGSEAVKAGADRVFKE